MKQLIAKKNVVVMENVKANTKVNNMVEKYFTVEEQDGKIWIIDNTACHIDGEPFKYKQVDKCRAEMLCEILNDLKSESFTLQDVMNIIHNIKYSNWKLEDLLDYVYGKADMDELWARYDDIHATLRRIQNEHN